ncbi:hypothetical protein [Paenibacillus flagellatus]|uniref:Uncharacterized protein n=1 Tax=Paenibacillus flagellatus TaxID=2211139 RepID=A0A2V5KV10_9BACL|nr:hypothetical protein [Paenibacillus flagellatus]PYI55877.1 hypothetical protein DLM86_09185 [Paenibacillus flagellatus]
MWKSRAGTVTVSLVLLIAPLFAFHAALIDAARVRMAERQAETATKAALRSVLSAYDPALQSYGLFGLGVKPEESDKLFTDVLKRNLNATGGGAFRLTEAVPSSHAIQPLYTLANRTVFERQVLEEMKYRAPVEFAVSVTDKLKNRSGATAMLAGVSAFADKAKQIGRLVDERESRLDDAWADARDLAEKASIYRGYYAKKLERLDELCRLIGLRDAEEVRRSIQSLRSQAEELRRTIADRQAGLAELVRAGVQAPQQIAAIAQSIGQLEQSVGALQTQIGELEKILEYIAEYTLLLPATKLEAKRDQAILAGLTQRVFTQLDEAKALDERIRAETGSLPADSGIPAEALQVASLPDAYYIKFRTGLGGIGALFGGFETALDATTLFTGANKFDSARMATLTASNEAYGQKASQFTGEQRIEEDKRAAAAERLTRRKREEKLRFAQLWDQARKIWAECGGADDESYRKLELGDPSAGKPSLYRQYSDYNRSEAENGTSVDELDDAEEAIDRTKGMIDRLLEGLTAAAGQFRDELYVNEFALTKFNYRTYGKEKGADGKPKPDYERSARGSHKLPNQEAEYVLYGLNSCQSNQAAAYTEMFAIRLAVRTAEALMSPESKVTAVGSPMLTLLWAIAEGAIRAYEDMTKLTNGEEVPVTAKAPEAVAMGYKDYLRLFLLLHTKREPTTARMQSLIELNTGRDLRGTAVYVQARTETKVRLWFMPYTMAAFGYPIEDGKAVVSKTASLSY